MVVIVVSPVDNYHELKEARHVVPLTDMATYITFKHPGKNRISAFILPRTVEETDKAMRQTAMARGYDGYSLTVLNSGGDKYWDDISENYECAPMLEVDIPDEAFAPPPAKWEKEWVTWLLTDGRFIDQCSFRQRRLFAYTLQVPVLLGNLALRFLLLTMATLFGTRGWKLRYLLHPLKYSLGESTEVMAGGSIFLRPEPEDWKGFQPDTVREVLSYSARRGWTMVFSPIFIALMTVATWGNMWFSIGKVAGAVVAIVSVVALMVWLMPQFFKWLGKMFEAGEVEYEQLVCDGEKRQPKKTIKLRYLDLKSKVCKPFAG